MGTENNRAGKENKRIAGVEWECLETAEGCEVTAGSPGAHPENAVQGGSGEAGKRHKQNTAPLGPQGKAQFLLESGAQASWIW